MSNVIRLFHRTDVESSSPELKRSVSAAVKNVLISNSQLSRAVSDLLVRFDAAENAIDGITETKIRSPLARTTKLSRTALSDALLKLSQEIQRLVEAANSGML